jgi:RHS repeat-associated protein
LQTELLTTKQLPISENAEYFWEKLQDSLVFEQAGFAVVSLKNSSYLPVLFDNLELTLYGTTEAIIVQENHYEPFGMTLRGLDYVLNPAQKNQFLFGGKEEENELDWNVDDFGARRYDRQRGQWNGIDEKAEKFYNFTPYNYCFNNPTNVVDLDGREGIIISGQPGDHDNRLHFLENGLDRAKSMAKDYKKAGKGEKATWFIYNGGGKGGYTAKEIESYKKKAEKAGVNVQVVSDTDKIVDYINNKNGGESREQDLITNFSYVGHATPGDLEIGYVSHNTMDEIFSKTLDVSSFDKEAFAQKSNANLVGGCRTAVDGFWSKSVVEQMADKIGKEGLVRGSDVRVFYSGGVVGDAQLVQKNNGNIVEVKGRGGNSKQAVEKKTKK